MIFLSKSEQTPKCTLENAIRIFEVFTGYLVLTVGCAKIDLRSIIFGDMGRAIEFTHTTFWIEALRLSQEGSFIIATPLQQALLNNLCARKSTFYHREYPKKCLN